MMGYGSSSNLSPLAPPFTVDRSTLPKPGPNPLLDLSERMDQYPSTFRFHTWVNTQQPISRPDLFSINPEFDPLLPGSTEYQYLPPTSSSSAAYVPSGSILSGKSSTGLPEVHPYYPSYVPPSVGDDVSPATDNTGYDLLPSSHVVSSIASSTDDYTHGLSGLECKAPQWAGLWGEGLTNWPQGNQIQLDGSFGAKDDYVNQGFYSCEGLPKYDQGSHCISVVGTEKHIESTNAVQVDYKSVLGDSKFIPTDFTTPPTLKLESMSAIVRPYPLAQSMGEITPRIPQMAYRNPYEHCSMSFDISPGDTSTFGKMESGSDGDKKELVGNNLTILHESHPFISSESKVHFDTSKLSFHLQEKGHDFAEFSSAKIEDFPSINDASREGFGSYSMANPVFQVSSVNLNDFGLNINENEVADSTENYSKNVDHLNPAVDSPCWRGAPVSHVSPFEASDAVTLQNMGKVKACSGSSNQSHDIFSHTANDGAKVSMIMPRKNLPHYDNSSPENLASSAKRPLVGNVLHNGGTDDALHPGHQRGNCGISQISDGIHKLKEERAVSDKSMGDSDNKDLNTEGKSLEDGKRTYEKNIGPGVADVDAMMNSNVNLDHGSYDVSFSHAENELCSQSSSKDVPTKITDSYCRDSVPKMHTQTLINTLHNLSELLLFHCLNETCELHEEECATLQGVISSLDACLLKKVERVASTQESPVPRSATSPVVGSSYELQKGALENQSFQEAELDFASGKKDEKLLNDVFARTAADRLKEENVTQAIKKILAENFHAEGETQPETLLYKNLWLEAEASLCSVNYMSRFNRMKVESEKLSPERATGNGLSFQVSTDPGRSKSSTANGRHNPLSDTPMLDLSILNSSNEDDVATRSNILKLQWADSNSASTLNIRRLSSSNASLDLNRIDKLAHEAKDGAKTALSVKDSPISSATSHAADDKASVLARFHVLKNQVDESNCMNTLTEENLSALFANTPDLNKVIPLENEVKDAANTDIPLVYLPKSSTSCPADDVEASVMARFHILKRRDGKSSPHSKEEAQLYDGGVGYVGQRRNRPVGNGGTEDRMFDAKVGRVANIPDPDKAGQLALKVNNAVKADTPIKHLQMSSAGSVANDVEASMKARFHILKCRDESVGYAGERRTRPIEDDGSEDRMINVDVEPELQSHATNSTKAKVMYKEFHLFAKDDLMNRSGIANQGDQSNAGWYDSFSSDWEHVLKEELAGQKC